LTPLLDGGQPRGSRGKGRRALDAPRTNEGRIEELRQDLADLRASRRRLVLAGDDERRTIERALHDGLQQRLVGLAANLELAAASADTDPAATIALLAAMRDDLQQALTGSSHPCWRRVGCVPRSEPRRPTPA
jgi:signal transduction histidine kinase